MNKASRTHTLPPDAEQIEQWTATPEYKQRASQWLENFELNGVDMPLDEAARSFAAACLIDVPLARGILKRVADPEGYAGFLEQRRGAN